MKQANGCSSGTRSCVWHCATLPTRYCHLTYTSACQHPHVLSACLYAGCAGFVCTMGAWMSHGCSSATRWDPDALVLGSD